MAEGSDLKGDLQEETPSLLPQPSSAIDCQQVSSALGWLDKLCADTGDTVSALDSQQLKTASLPAPSDTRLSADSDIRKSSLTPQEVKAAGLGKINMKRRHSLKPRNRPTLQVFRDPKSDDAPTTTNSS